MWFVGDRFPGRERCGYQNRRQRVARQDLVEVLQHFERVSAGPESTSIYLRVAARSADLL
jgi:hypothetical protein